MLFRKTILVAVWSLILLTSAVFFGAPTWAQPSGTQTVTQPILFLYDSEDENPFHEYLPEVLRTEGIQLITSVALNEFPDSLQQYSLIILAETDALSSEESDALENYVQNGGMLFALRPQESLLGLFDLELEGGTTTGGYLLMSENQEITEGLIKETIQFHGAASHYAAGPNAVSLAALYSDSSTSTPYVAASYAQAGEGYAAQMAFDIARSVAYLRQGNPEWKNQDSNGDGGMRPNDLFVNPLDNNDHWNDYDKLDIPQADEQMRLFSNTVMFLLSKARTPIPRFWYFPDFASSVVISTGDEHDDAAESVEDRFDELEENWGGTGTAYLHSYTDSAPVPSSEERTAWVNAGNEVSIHPYYQDLPDSDQSNITLPGAATVYENSVAAFMDKYGVSPGFTVRNHFLFWTGWHDMAELQAESGFRMGLDYYICCQAAEEGYGVGFFTGSSLPMKYATEDGEPLNIYQQQTDWSDETWPEGYNDHNRAVMRFVFDSINIFHTAITGHSHIAVGIPEYLSRAYNYSTFGKGLSIRSAERWYQFWSTRNDIAYDDYSYDQATGELSFTVTIPDTGVIDDSYTLLLPYALENSTLTTLQVDDVTEDIATRRIRGREYTYLDLSPGEYEIEANYTFVTITNPFVFVQDAPEDFLSCTFNDASYVKTDDPGIELSSSLYDDFDDDTFDTDLWVAGTWADPHGAYTPDISDGILTLYQGSDGAFMRSQDTWSRRVLEARALYTPGQHKHVGFGTLDFGSDYMTFRGNNTNTIALTSGGSQEIYTMPFHEFRTYRVDNTQSTGETLHADYYINNSLEKRLDNGITSSMHVYFSNNNTNEGSVLELDWVKLHDYPSTSGSFQSCTIDTGETPAGALSLDWRATTPEGTTVSFQTRTSSNGSDWSEWSTAISNSGENTDSTPARYVQYRTNLGGTSTVTPTVHSVELRGLDISAPLISNVAATPETEEIQVAWDTNKKSSGTVQYGVNNTYGSSLSVNNFPRTFEHSATLTNLVNCTRYHYRVAALDGGLNANQSTDHTAITAGCSGGSNVLESEVGVIPATGGALSLLLDDTGIMIDAPEDFHDEALTFQILHLAGEAFEEEIGAPFSLLLLSQYVYELRALADVNTLQSSFAEPIEIQMSYNDEDVEGLEEESLVISRWDGDSWHELLNCEVDTENNVVTCVTTQFSTFVLAGEETENPEDPDPEDGSGSSGSSDSRDSSPSTPVCKARNPGSKAPNLYAATALGSDRIQLYFAAADGPLDRYVIEYGVEQGNYNFGGVEVLDAQARTFTIGSLSPNTTYYFRVRAGNECAPGNWSNELSGHTLRPFQTNLLQMNSGLLGFVSGQESSLVQTEEEQADAAEAASISEEEVDTATIQIKVVDPQGQPIVGAKVTLHSTPRETTTDEYGIAIFSEVEPGQHRVVVEHGGFRAEQSLFLEDSAQVELEVTARQQSLWQQRPVQVIFGAIAILVVLGGVIWVKAGKPD